MERRKGRESLNLEIKWEESLFFYLFLERVLDFDPSIPST